MDGQPQLLHVLVRRVAVEDGFNGGYGLGTALLEDGSAYEVALRLTRYEIGHLAARLQASATGEVLAQVPRCAVYLAEPAHELDSPEMPSWPLYDQQTRPRPGA